MASFDDDYVVRTFSPALVDGKPDEATAAWLGATRIGFHEKADADAVRESAIGSVDDGRVFTGVYPRRPVAGGLDETWPVGTFTGYTKTINVGGGRLVDAYLVSDVTVRPTHRRRGMLRTLMTERLAAAAASGHALAALTASESTIYRRFGYGPATRKRTVVLERDVPVTLLAQPTGRVEMASPTSLAAIAPRVFARFHETTPGSVDRQGQYSNLYNGLTYGTAKPDDELRAAIHVPDSGEADGYVLYSMREEAGASVLEIADLVSATADAFLGLWDFLGSVDLVQRIRWSKAPVETPLLHALTASRSLQTERESDHVWLRVLDVQKALSARPYARDGEITLRVHDKLGHAEGTFRLEVVDGVGHATRIADSAPASLELDAATLATLYLGGVPVSVLGEAGLVVEHTRGAIRLATQMFAADRPVYGVTDF
ncbi:putative acetyltransferase [Frondihabitans sp. PhB188]|uniref:GNAT family N-acetyltransferase n=1 Tax=Frondihabitans sp. PhB188 TaxID=2485200 RepID=UPI000F4A3474|nr:GNAT family N-acetyltransferase [Frondihabitans sp. PhB188]ROQ39974.1 putative acetyltransferase [Frondihabitans sp. PhB188]